MTSHVELSPERARDARLRLTPNSGSTAAATRRRVGGATTRIRRAVREFLLLPAIVVVAYAALGIASIALDKSTPHALVSLQHSLAQVISRKAASSLLSGIATSVVTVTSITFSVLLLAVQQTASSMTPAVFDQFLRRRTNQLYLGMFVGLSLYAFLVLASIGPKAAPTFGATIALLLTIAAFCALVVLIYSTVDQMRPSSVAQVIHDRALRARLSELELLRRTRRKSRGSGPIHAPVHAEQDGYVTGIDIERILDAIPDTEGAEVNLEITLGDSVVFGQRLATVTDDDEACSERVAEAVRRSVLVDRERDIGIDASFAVEQLGNIAWTALSTAKQNPQTGREAVDRLRDLGARWSRVDPEVPRGDDSAPLVYADRDLDIVLDTLLTCVVVCAESSQVASAAHVIEALSDVLGVVPDEKVEALEAALTRTLAVMDAHPVTRPLERALERLAACLDERDASEAAQKARELVLAAGEGRAIGPAD